MLRDTRAPFDAWLAEPVELHENGAQVMVIVRSRVRPKGSSREIEFRNGHVWTIRDGAILSFAGFPRPAEALEAAGLSV